MDSYVKIMQNCMNWIRTAILINVSANVYIFFLRYENLTSWLTMTIWSKIKLKTPSLNWLLAYTTLLTANGVYEVLFYQALVKPIGTEANSILTVC